MPSPISMGTGTMRLLTKGGQVAGLVWLLVLLAGSLDAAGRYYVAQSLTVSSQGISGTSRIELLRDRRLRGKKAPLEIEGPESEGYLPAVLSLKTPDGVIAASKLLERTDASMKWSKLDGPGPVIELTVDYTTGMGTYNGPITSFLLLGLPGLELLKVAGTAGQGQKELRLMDNGYRAIWAVKDPHTILAAFASPSLNGEEGEVELKRFSLEGGAWVRHALNKKGPSDFESWIPPEKDYP